MKDFPSEQYVDLENNPYLKGRIIIHMVKDTYHAEVDIIHSESHKIFKHVGIIYHQHSAHEALLTGVQRLRQFLEKVEEAHQENSKSNLH